MTTEPTVPVTQADKDAVTAFHNRQLARILAGDKTLGENRDTIEQAFARHRLAAEQSRASTPAVGREAIARIVDHAVLTVCDGGTLVRETPEAPLNLSLLTADAILALQSPPATGEAAITEAAKRMVAAQGMAWSELDGHEIGYWRSLASAALSTEQVR